MFMKAGNVPIWANNIFALLGPLGQLGWNFETSQPCAIRQQIKSSKTQRSSGYWETVGILFSLYYL